jgi:hypothetical protein
MVSTCRGRGDSYSFFLLLVLESKLLLFVLQFVSESLALFFFSSLEKLGLEFLPEVSLLLGNRFAWPPLLSGEALPSLMCLLTGSGLYNWWEGSFVISKILEVRWDNGCALGIIVGFVIILRFVIIIC